MGWQESKPSRGPQVGGGPSPEEAPPGGQGGVGQEKRVPGRGGPPTLSEGRPEAPTPYSVLGPKTPNPSGWAPQLQGEHGDAEGAGRRRVPRPGLWPPHCRRPPPFQRWELSGCISTPRPPWGVGPYPPALCKPLAGSKGVKASRGQCVRLRPRKASGTRAPTAPPPPPSLLPAGPWLHGGAGSAPPHRRTGLWPL